MSLKHNREGGAREGLWNCTLPAFRMSSQVKRFRVGSSSGLLGTSEELPLPPQLGVCIYPDKVDFLPMINMLNPKTSFPEKCFGWMRVTLPPPTGHQNRGAGVMPHVRMLGGDKTPNYHSQLHTVLWEDHGCRITTESGQGSRKHGMMAPQLCPQGELITRQVWVCHLKWGQWLGAGIHIKTEFLLLFFFVVWFGFERISVLMSPNGHNGG